MSDIANLENSLGNACEAARSSGQQGAVIAFVAAIVLAIAAYMVWTGQKTAKKKSKNPPMLAIALAILAVLSAALGAYWWMSSASMAC